MPILDTTIFKGLSLEGKYALESLINHGRLCDVYLARHAINSHIKIVKIFVSNSPETADTMRREAIAAQLLKNTPLACVAEKALLLNTPEGEFPALVFPYIDAPVLGEWLETTRPLQSKLNILKGVLQTLSRVHNAGIYHNDLGFGNLMIGLEGPTLIDFGRCEIDTLNPPPILSKPNAFYDVNSTGENADLRAFVILAYLLISYQHPYIRDLAKLLSGDWKNESPFKHDPKPFPPSADIDEDLRQHLDTLLYPILSGAKSKTAQELLALWRAD